MHTAYFEICMLYEGNPQSINVRWVTYLSTLVEGIVLETCQKWNYQFYRTLFGFNCEIFYWGGQMKGKILRCKKKTTSSIWPKSKIPDIQVVQIAITDNLYRRDFWFFKNWGWYFFLQKKLFAASLFTRSNKTCNIFQTTRWFLLF